MYRRHCLKILSLVLMFGSAVGLAGAAVAADISVTSTFVLPPTCDATAGAGKGVFVTPDGEDRNWSDANSYCTGQGMRMPTISELTALYNTYPNDQIASVCGWKTTAHFYWSSTEESPGFHYMIDLNDGGVFVGLDVNNNYVACVR